MVPTSNQSRLRTVWEAREIPLRMASATLSELVPTISVMAYVWSAIGCPLLQDLWIFTRRVLAGSLASAPGDRAMGGTAQTLSDAVPVGCPRGRPAPPGCLPRYSPSGAVYPPASAAAFSAASRTASAPPPARPAARPTRNAVSGAAGRATLCATSLVRSRIRSRSRVDSSRPRARHTVRVHSSRTFTAQAPLLAVGPRECRSPPSLARPPAPGATAALRARPAATRWERAQLFVALASATHCTTTVAATSCPPRQRRHRVRRRRGGRGWSPRRRAGRLQPQRRALPPRGRVRSAALPPARCLPAALGTTGLRRRCPGHVEDRRRRFGPLRQLRRRHGSAGSARRRRGRACPRFPSVAPCRRRARLRPNQGRGRSRSSADRGHGPVGLQEARIVYAVTGLLARNADPDAPRDLRVVGSPAQGGTDVGLLAGEQAVADLSVGSEPH